MRVREKAMTAWEAAARFACLDAGHAEGDSAALTSKSFDRHNDYHGEGLGSASQNKNHAMRASVWVCGCVSLISSCSDERLQAAPFQHKNESPIGRCGIRTRWKTMPSGTLRPKHSRQLRTKGTEYALRGTKPQSTAYFTLLLNQIQSHNLTIRLPRSPRITPSVPREKHQLTCRNTTALQSSLTATPSTIARATATNRAYAIAKTYKPGGVVILGSHRPGFR